MRNINETAPKNAMRINKYISEKGICSRREADRFIEQKRVTINGSIAMIGSVVHAGDEVKIDNKPLKARDNFVYLVLNKPVGIVCTTDTRERDNIIDFMNYPKRIFPIGRLDKDSEGLIMLTSDGDIVNKILRAGNNHEKEYIVRVDKPISPGFINGMANGVKILGTITKKCRVELLTKYTFRIVLTEGMNRQIRRMCEAFGYQVLKLKRIRIMNINLEELPTGSWRYLSPEELAGLNQLIKNSIKTEEASK
ncbi:MAG: 23S rRNA pseudouridine synthase F [Clostridiales bacterium GWB2_37_7]|nr:MAG: 23S rRNA pseudouridine synthase F [Clostridiales bacterium GWB2_37_7]